MTSQEALALLKEGNARFSQGKPERPNQDEARRTNIADKGQNPFAAVLSCSDSRKPVELLFDRGLGDIFVVRVAGNVAGVDQVGSLEYAVEHLGVPLIVVLGHNKCGAVTAVVEGYEAHGNIRAIVEKIAPVVEETRKVNPNLPMNKLVDECVLANVRHVAHYLSANSAIIKHAVESGALKIIGANYHIRTGQVSWE
ncbi:MAG: carbonic anhydrase [Deltaproteobacteria bacterium]|nr:carbonic anhydrase [Deltaproteobacteria bacterium]